MSFLRFNNVLSSDNIFLSVLKYKVKFDHQKHLRNRNLNYSDGLSVYNLWYFCDTNITTMTLDEALTNIMQLDDSSREMLLDILLKRQAETRRGEIARDATKSLKEYRSGKYMPLSTEEAISDHLNAL